MAIWHRGRCDALLHHSDRCSSQYTSEQFQIASFGKAVLVHAFVKGINERCARLCRAADRWGGDDAERTRRGAAELIALGSDAILASGTPSVAALQQATDRLKPPQSHTLKLRGRLMRANR